jgi:hypothetical protein
MLPDDAITVTDWVVCAEDDTALCWVVCGAVAAPVMLSFTERDAQPHAEALDALIDAKIANAMAAVRARVEAMRHARET